MSPVELKELTRERLVELVARLRGPDRGQNVARAVSDACWQVAQRQRGRNPREHASMQATLTLVSGRSYDAGAKRRKLPTELTAGRCRRDHWHNQPAAWPIAKSEAALELCISDACRTTA